MSEEAVNIVAGTATATAEETATKETKITERGMVGSSCNARTRSGASSRYPHSISRKRSRGTATSIDSTTRLRYSLRSGSGSILHCRSLWGEQSGRSGGGSGRNRDDNDRENDNDRNIEDDGKDRDYGGGGRRGSGNCNSNAGSADSGMRIGGKGLIPIPEA